MTDIMQEAEYFVSCDISATVHVGMGDGPYEGSDESNGLQGERDGTRERPWRSIAEARDAVRSARAAGFAGQATVWIGPGRYLLDEPLAFDGRDSGAGEEGRTIYSALPGAAPVISGGRLLTDWEPAGAGVYRCHVGPDALSAYGYTLFENGERAAEARSPKQGYHVVDGRIEGESGSGFRFKRDDFPLSSDASTDGLKAFIWPGEGEWNWFTETKPVAAVDWERATIAFDDPAPWGIDQGSRYRLQGAKELLTEPGEFCRDAREGFVYYRPRRLPIEEQEIMLPLMRSVIDIRGGCGNGGSSESDGSVSNGESDDGIVRHLAFRGLTVEMSDFVPSYRMPVANREREAAREGLIRLDNAERIVIADCTLRHAGLSGIVLNGRCQAIRIDGNTIERLGYNGIYAIGFAPGEGDFGSAAESDVNGGHAIVRNAIRGGGELIGHGSGIQLYQSGGCTIEGNVIRGFPRYGISLKGLRYKAMAERCYGTEVTWDNHWELLHARNNAIIANDISDVMKDSQDGGMFEAWGAGLGNRIVGNRFHDSGIFFSVGYGIYLDDAADGFLVARNVLHDLYAEGKGKLWFAIFAKGIGNVIENNLLVRNAAKAAVGSQEMAGEPNRGLVVRRNAVIDSGEQLYHFINWSDDRLAEADGNLFYRSGGEAPTVSGCYGDDKYGTIPVAWEAWREVLGGRFDGRTIAADPLLEEPARGRFRFRPDSPVWALGWQAPEEDA